MAAHVIVVAEHGKNAVAGLDRRECLERGVQLGVRVVAAMDKVAGEQDEIRFQAGKLPQHAYAPPVT